MNPYIQTSERIYCDYNASTPLLKEVRKKLEQTYTLYGNPSSIHSEGRATRSAIEQARQMLAQAVGAESHHVVFTSGGSEANTLACSDFFYPFDYSLNTPRKYCFLSATEHDSVWHIYRANPPSVIPVSKNGIVDSDWLSTQLSELKEKDPAALIHVCVQFANNETGIIQPIKKIAACVHSFGGMLHCDAVQGLGKDDINIKDLGADSYAFSAHKIGGPKGIGALIFSSDSAQKAHIPFARGGGQERGYRSGTECVSGIIGFGAAAEVMLGGQTIKKYGSYLSELRNYFELELQKFIPNFL